MRGALVAGAALTVALAGCGGGPDEGQAKDRAKAFLDALRARDGERACSYLTDDGRVRFTQLGDVPCAQGVLHVNLPPQAKVSAVKISGDQATVSLKDPTGRPAVIVLKKTGGDWKVDTTSG